jgi:hypothetical protein
MDKMDKKNIFIDKSNKKHNHKYDYSKVEYINSKNKVIIICPKHGEFSQLPNKHVFGWGCKKCGIEKRSKSRTKTTQDFIYEASKVNDNKFDYSKVEYKHGKKKVEIKCEKGHIFQQTPNSHLKKHGCPICTNKKRLTNEEFINKSKIIHDNKYNYELVIYKNANTKVKIICKEHGEFEQIPNSHIRGKGCKKCTTWKEEQKLFKKIKKLFPNDLIEQHYKTDWIKLQNFDIYFVSHNIAIEYNGVQHYEPIEYFGGVEAFIKQVERDNRKRKLCLENDCALVEVPYWLKEKEIDNLLKKVKNKIYENTSKIT